MSLGGCCNNQCSCECCEVPCLCPERDCATGQYFYYGIDSLNRKIKMSLVVVSGIAVFVPVQVLCQLPGPVLANGVVSTANIPADTVAAVESVAADALKAAGVKSK